MNVSPKLCHCRYVKRGGLGKALTTLSRKKTDCYENINQRKCTNLGEGVLPMESMTSCSESRKETTSPMPFLFSKK